MTKIKISRTMEGMVFRVNIELNYRNRIDNSLWRWKPNFIFTTHRILSLFFLVYVCSGIYWLTGYLFEHKAHMYMHTHKYIVCIIDYYFVFIFILLYAYGYLACIYVCMCITCMPSACRCQGLELETVVRCHVGFINWIQVLWKKFDALNHWAIFPSHR